MADLPDFIIGGAPKCGTTSLHFILGQHPDIGLPDNEILYHDADDPVVHPDFLKCEDDGVSWYDPESQIARDWYRTRFTPFEDRNFTGEDSPTYLFSDVAAERIKRHLPDARLIFLLRHPVKRAYSQYWHLVKSGRAVVSFEQALSDHPSIILGSSYARHLERYFDLFGRERVFVQLFEDFIQSPQTAVDRVLAHIGAAPMTVSQDWYNRTKYPSWPGGQRMLNRVGRHVVATRYGNHMGENTTARRRMTGKLHYRWFKYVNPVLLKADRPPEMKPATRAYLEQHLSARNAGLSKLLDRDLSTVWQGVTA